MTIVIIKVFAEALSRYVPNLFFEDLSYWITRLFKNIQKKHKFILPLLAIIYIFKQLAYLLLQNNLRLRLNCFLHLFFDF